MLNLLYYGYFYFFRLLRHRIFHTTLQHTMQHVVSTPSTYPGSCKSYFSRKPVFGGNFLLIFPIIYQIAHLHNWPSFPLIFADSCPGCQNYPVLTGLGWKMSSSLSSLIYFIETRRACILRFFRPFWHTNYIEIIRLVDQSCQNQSSWWLCRRHTRSMAPWLIKSGPSTSY